MAACVTAGRRGQFTLLCPWRPCLSLSCGLIRCAIDKGFHRVNQTGGCGTESLRTPLSGCFCIIQSKAHPSTHKSGWYCDVGCIWHQSPGRVWKLLPKNDSEAPTSSPPKWGKNCSDVAKRKWLQIEGLLVTCLTLTNVLAVSTNASMEAPLAEKPVNCEQSPRHSPCDKRERRREREAWPPRVVLCTAQCYQLE